MFQESSSLYPNLIDLETELFPPPYADPHLPLLPQVPQVSSGEARRRTEPSAHPREGGPAQGTREKAREMANVAEEDPEVPSSTVHVSGPGGTSQRGWRADISVLALLH